ncbi:GD23862 [Drosophila simulans]|uniref:non-specific serine/threonine protein kinase n=1 Tax=Drosophila simulans TaxID=7240 RepID=B4Q4A9_DROSI|nr:GD23862 [Drosophila simulans]
MSTTSVVQQFVNGLKSRNRNVQNKATQDLLFYVKTELREMSQEELAQFFDEFDHHIFTMVNATDINEKKGGALAMKCLINCEGSLTARKGISPYLNRLRDLLLINDVSVMEIAARSLVKLANMPTSKGADSFDFDIKKAFEVLRGERQEYRRHSAVFILRELAIALPTYFYQHILTFFEVIFNAIFDPKPAIRESAGEALRAALIVTAQRESTKQSSEPQWYRICYDEANGSFNADLASSKDQKGVTRDDRIHGGLVVFNELFRCANATWERRYTSLKTLFPKTQHNKFLEASSSSSMGSQLNTLVPRLKVPFIDKLGSSQTHLGEGEHHKGVAKFASILRGKEKDRTVAYITIGYIAVAVQSAIEVHLSSIMTSVKVALPAKDLTSKRKVPVDPAVFACITLLAHAVKSEIADDVKDILEQMFYTGLSPALTVCLRELSENVPQLKSAITEGLIGILSQVLMNKAAVLPYTALPTIAIDGSLMQNGDGATTVLALKTLGTFNFEEQNMLDFVQRCADFFIVHEQQEIRLEAVQTCTRLLKLAVQSSESMENSKTLSDTVSHVIERLLMVAITDMDCNVRIRILRSLDETFDGKLAQPESLNSLFITLHDEIFEIRELAMVTIGRLSSINPAYVMPKLRTTMIELITDLKYSGMSRNKEQSAKMLDHLVISTPRLISSYMNPILKALVPKLHEPESNPGVILNVLRTIGDLAEVNGGSDEMELWADDLLSILLEMLGDAGSPDKRGVALWTLGQLISATGRVVSPYHKYPVLIDILINFLKTEQRRSIRRETIRVLGLLGAMDPYKHKMNKGLIDSQKDNVLIAYSDGKVDESQDISTAELLVNMGNALDEYYPAVAIAALMRILRDPTLSTRHTSVVQAVTFIFQSLGIKCVPYLAQVLPNLLDNVRTADNNLREFLFQQLAILVAFVKLHIISYMGDIFKLIKEFWTINTPLQNTLINLIEQIAVALGCEFRDYLAELIPQILRVLQHDNSKDRMVTRRLLQALQKFGSTLGYYLPLILPPIVKLFDSPDEVGWEWEEHCDRDPIPIQTKLLGTRAMACRAYAKALRYKEEEFLLREDSQVFESLILINNKLQQREAAEGLLTRYRNAANELNVQGRWYEKLHNWDEALEHYERNLKTNSSDLEARLGHMRCLEALGDWSELSNVTKHEWETFGAEAKSRAGPLAAVAAWGLQDWEAMREYVRCIPEDTQDGSYYRAVLAVHHDDFETAQRLIDETRDLLDTELTSMAGESYERAYGAMVCVQMLAELEEVIQYKLIPERREPLKTMWWKRLQGGQRLVEDWRRIIQVHSLVVKPHDDIHTWLKYASLCRKSGSLHLSHKTLVMLLGTDPKLNPNQPLPCNQPQVTYAYTKYMAANNQLQEAYEQLTHFVSTYSQELSCLPPEALKQQDQRLMARCYLRMATWQNKLQDSIRPDAIQGALECFEKATSYDPNWYKAWHLWAYMNFKVVQAQKSALDKQQPPGASMGLDSDLMIIQRYAVPAVQGFFRSISLIKGNSLQDTLRLLTLWFDYGNHAEVYEALLSGMKLIEINTWLQVIPQLIARIDTHRQLVGQLIHQLLMDIGKNHPQALVYPLTVASKSASLARRNAAFKILDSMTKHSPTLVEQAVMCSEELIRVAILWHEQWHEGLEEASRLYFGDRNVKGMFEILEPLHAMLERGPQTLKETSFSQAYGRELTEAYEWSQRYKTSAVVMDLDRAWDIYYHVFQKISRQLPQLTSLELPYVSPKLTTCKDLELAVPGSYNPGQELIRISIIKTNLQVITSKQRPRKLCIRGSNGKDYMYLLKGHEDLRQDERVMQLFSLVNTLLLDDPDTFRRNLAIQRYAVIPLSTNSGLIGWVPHCDTLHTLIRDYRDKKKVPLNQEHRTMLNFAPDYDHLTLMQKVEVFEHALGQTQGDDLAKLLWLKSPSSELWFERRNNYTRSLAVMSMVGYILGLGDRHPSNLMLDRMSGKILHIDFGDCFEVAMTREKFPEKIPFRLTRMLIKAMEVTGIEGTYRRTCESVMLVLRRNKDSLMAVLEAFVYDPLLNWRLLDVDKKGNDAVAGAGAPGGRGGSGMQDSLSNSVEDSLPMAKSKPYDPTLQQGGLHNNVADETNSKASQVIKRVKCKLTGTDFQTEKSVNEQSQVELLIQQATNNENLCQCYIGWCPFW